MQKLSETKDKTLMLKLRESTRELHDAAESNDFQKQLGRGTVSKKDYCIYLGQLYLLHKRLAEHLAASKSATSIDAVIEEHHLDVSCLESDLDYFGQSTEDVTSLEATRRLTDYMSTLEQSSASALLGILYVLEGSTHGAKMLASNLQKGLELPEKTKGASYFVRYGDLQMERWLEFKKRMNSLELSEEAEDEILESAKRTFKAYDEIGNEILS